MNLKKTVVAERLDKLRRVANELDALAEMPKMELQNDLSKTWSVERGIQLGAEAVFDIGSHILVADLNESPETYEDIIVLLQRRKVISDELAERFVGLGGFRNILVHDYLKVDRDLVYEYLKNAAEKFLDFADEIDAYLESRER